MNQNRNYKIVRIHEGVVTVIEGTYDPVTYLFTFETDRFSTYALAYEDNDPDTNTKTNIATGTNDFYHFCLTAKATASSQKLTYNKVAGAEGYILYGINCGLTNKLVKLADLSGKTTSYTHKNLEKATYYKYYVQAYKIVNGKKVVIATSKIIHSTTTSEIYGNPTEVVSDTAVVTMNVGASKKVTASIVLPNGKITENHVSDIRYETTDKRVATVDQNGNIKAKSKGSCYLYIYAQNGVYKKIKVTVK
jgi:hypothetical protein